MPRGRGGKSNTFENSRTAALEKVYKEIRNAAPVDLPNEDGTPLTLAVKKGLIDCIRTLLQYGVDANLCSLDGKSPLLTAVESGNSDCVQALIDAGADVAHSDSCGQTPLHRAAAIGMSDIVSILLSYGADPFAINQCNETAVFVACQNGKHECLQLLLDVVSDKRALVNESGADANLCSSSGMSPLLAAIQSGNINCVETLIKAGADLSVAAMDGPLHEAAAHGMSDMVRLLLSLGADACAVDGLNQTAAFGVCANGDVLCLQLLLDAVVDKAAFVNKVSDLGETCVHLACAIGKESCLKILLENGADVNLCAVDGIHPICMVVSSGSIACARLIMPYVDKDVVFRSEEDPVYAVVDANNMEMLDLFIANGYPVNRSSDRYLDLEHGDKFSVTPLGCAVVRLNLDIVRKLLDSRAEMHPEDTTLSSPLLLAIAPRTPEFLNEFLKRNVDLNFIDPKSAVKIPDPFLVPALPEHRYHLLPLLKAGLKPCLEQWCRLKNGKCSATSLGPENVTFFGAISKKIQPEQLEELIRIVLPFSKNGLPNCCDAWTRAFGERVPDFGTWKDTPPSLAHFCRIKIRDQLSTKQLFSEDWIEKINIPVILKDYLIYKNI